MACATHAVATGPFAPQLRKPAPAALTPAATAAHWQTVPPWPGYGPSPVARRGLLNALLIAVVGPATGISLALLLSTAHPPKPESALRSAVQAISNARLVPATGRVNAHPPTTAAALPTAWPTQADTASAAIHLTRAASRMARWIDARGDNAGVPYLIIDKREARVFVFDPFGLLIASAPVLLGSARGDDTYPGIGQVPVQQVKPWQRTTPAGRFATRPGLDDEHHDIVWIDYDAAVALHRVIDKVRAERRPERLASANPRVRRISFGCVNVPIPFFDQVIAPIFGKHPGVAYIIPEVHRFDAVFGRTGASAGTARSPSTAALKPAEVR